MAGEIAGLLSIGLFGTFFLGALPIGLIELAGRFYGTQDCLVRKDLTTEQMIINLLGIDFIPFG